MEQAELRGAFISYAINAAFHAGQGRIKPFFALPEIGALIEGAANSAAALDMLIRHFTPPAIPAKNYNLLLEQLEAARPDIAKGARKDGTPTKTAAEAAAERILNRPFPLDLPNEASPETESHAQATNGQAAPLAEPPKPASQATQERRDTESTETGRPANSSQTEATQGASIAKPRKSPGLLDKLLKFHIIFKCLGLFYSAKEKNFVNYVMQKSQNKDNIIKGFYLEAISINLNEKQKNEIFEIIGKSRNKYLKILNGLKETSETTPIEEAFSDTESLLKDNLNRFIYAGKQCKYAEIVQEFKARNKTRLDNLKRLFDYFVNTEISGKLAEAAAADVKAQAAPENENEAEAAAADFIGKKASKFYIDRLAMYFQTCTAGTGLIFYMAKAVNAPDFKDKGQGDLFTDFLDVPIPPHLKPEISRLLIAAFPAYLLPRKGHAAPAENYLLGYDSLSRDFFRREAARQHKIIVSEKQGQGLFSFEYETAQHNLKYGNASIKIILDISALWNMPPADRALNEFDGLIYRTIASLYYAGNTEISVNTIFERMGHKKSISPTEKEKEKIMQSIRKMRKIDIIATRTEADCKAFPGGFTEYKLQALLNADLQGRSINGTAAECAIIKAAPVLTQIPLERKQIYYIDFSYLKMPLAITVKNIELWHWLNYQINLIKSKKNNGIIFETCFKQLGITTAQAKQRTKTKILKLLQCWKQCGQNLSKAGKNKSILLDFRPKPNNAGYDIIF